MHGFTLTVLTAAIALVALAPGMAHGQPPALVQKQLAKQHFDEGRTFFDLGRFRDAIGEFKRSYVLFPTPETLFMLGQCHNQLGEPRQAIHFYRRYLEQKGDVADRAEVEVLIREAEAKARARK